jgi:hypothetical protein
MDISFANYYIETTKNILINSNRKNLTMTFYKQEFEILEKAKDESLKLYWKESAIDPVFSDCVDLSGLVSPITIINFC